ncbi:unnamed protein product, partial [Effrenium voratum]
QDYKEAFSKSDVFAILVRLLLDAMEEVGANREFFKEVLMLLRNLVSVPDPGKGDAGYTPMRHRMQLSYIRLFFDEGVLDFINFLGADLVLREDVEDQIWAVADIIYHLCTHFDPQDLWQSQKAQSKGDLAELMTRDKADSKLLAPQSSRHGRFGTSMAKATSDGSLSLLSTVNQSDIIQKSSSVLGRKEFRNPLGSDKKQNMFKNPFFVDLGEGSVRDHNQLNPHVRGALDDRTNHNQKILQGYRNFMQKAAEYFSSLVSIMRSTCKGGLSKNVDIGTELNMPHLINYVSWWLEFFRCQHAAQVAEAKKKKAPLPDLDIAMLQGAIDIDMIQFTTARLREFGKEEKFNHSQLVVVLRVLSQQIQTIKEATEASISDTSDCGEILVRHMVKENTLGNISWIMKNFKSSSHDPRILTYCVEVWQYITGLMNKMREKYPKDEFQVDKIRGKYLTRTTTSTEKEIAGLADSRVVENLFHMLEKYRRLSPTMQSMLVELLRSIIQAEPTNIVLFFELTYFMSIFRILHDPLLTNAKNNKKYKDITGLFQFILQEFFQCAEVNHCVFAELLFRKVQEKSADSIESSNNEFAAILSNYEDEGYRQKMERIGAGETMDQVLQKQREMLKGQQPWTEEEDNVLRECYPRYAEHPLCAELLAAELPESSRRTTVQVRRRLGELNLRAEPPSKKQKVFDSREPEAPEEAGAPASPGTPKRAAAEQEEEMLEEDLERLLDAAYDSFPGTDSAGKADQAGPTPASTVPDEATVREGSTVQSRTQAGPTPASTVPDEATVREGSTVQSRTQAGPTPASTMPDEATVREGSGKRPRAQASQGVPESLELDLAQMMDDLPASPGKQPKTQASQGVPESLELELEQMMDDLPASPGKLPKTQASQGVPESLEMELEQMMDDLPASPGKLPKTQASQGVPDSLELGLEQMMDDLSASAGQQPKTQASQGVPDSLELGLEQMMDDLSASAGKQPKTQESGVEDMSAARAGA